MGRISRRNVISDFEEQFGVNVIIEYFDSNEMMYTKLRAETPMTSLLH